MNTTVKPCDNVNVRKAVAAVIDGNALVATRGGSRIGPVATHYIPPFLPGFQEAGGSKSPYDYMSQPNGNLALAKRYMRKAGYASGRDNRPSPPMVGDDFPPAENTSGTRQSQLP